MCFWGILRAAGCVQKPGDLRGLFGSFILNISRLENDPHNYEASSENIDQYCTVFFSLSQFPAIR